MNETDKNNKTKKTLFTILVIVVIVALGLIIYQYILPYSGYKAGTEVQEEGETEEGPQEELEEGEGTLTKEIDCEEECKEDERCIILCENADIIEKALEENDLTVCEQLGQNAKDVCQNQVYLKRATLEGNIELCNNITEEDILVLCLDLYYYQKAKSTKDTSYCVEIKDTKIKLRCEAIE